MGGERGEEERDEEGVAEGEYAKITVADKDGDGVVEREDVIDGIRGIEGVAEGDSAKVTEADKGTDEVERERGLKELDGE